MSNETSFDTFLNQQNEEAWASALATLLRSIHEVDRNAPQIWFAFYPLPLFCALREAGDRDQLVQQLLLQGDYELKDQIDTSHRFLYGHRFWPQVKRAVEAHAEEWHRLQSVSSEGSPVKAYATSLPDQILAVARAAAQQTKAGDSLLTGITAVAFMTVQQVGLAAFKAAPGKTNLDKKYARKSPDQIVRQRAKDDSQGLFGFLKTVNKQFTVTHDENDDQAKYKLNEGQDLAWGAAEDRSRDWVAIDPRRMEGPIPVECRSASCGTCWVGVVGGAERLSDVAVREGKKIKEFGYIDSAEPRPLIRLACQALAQGAVSVVIPPWNGQFGKYLKSLKQEESQIAGLVEQDTDARPEAIQ